MINVLVPEILHYDFLWDAARLHEKMDCDPSHLVAFC